MLQYEHARSALKLGLELGQELGANPYKFGLVGASDVHTGIATTREENYFGKYQHTEPSPDRHMREVIPADDPALRVPSVMLYYCLRSFNKNTEIFFFFFTKA